MKKTIDQNLLAANIDTIRSVFKMDYTQMQIMGAFICTLYDVVAEASFPSSGAIWNC